ncbi:hypothetical protein [Rhizobacter sp. Root29]|uniref:hypothetical protein n=1 Tax=Rhizobacter sp. Root29 TaxID=1736511 RepID=UPI001F401C17|nr:hypothetical protein [Rhizobacter sp. Root29]
MDAAQHQHAARRGAGGGGGLSSGSSSGCGAGTSRWYSATPFTDAAPEGFSAARSHSARPRFGSRRASSGQGDAACAADAKATSSAAGIIENRVMLHECRSCQTPSNGSWRHLLPPSTIPA